MLPLSQPPRMPADAIRFLRQMVHEQGRTPSAAAGILQNSLGSVCRQLAKARPTTTGRQLALSPRQVDKLITLTEAMVKENGNLEARARKAILGLRWAKGGSEAQTKHF